MSSIITNRTRHLFLFGAGASAFSGPSLPQCPPLGANLIDHLLPYLRAAPSIDNDLCSLFRRDFEEGMDAFWRRSPALLQNFQKDMAMYFSYFRPLPGNLYKQLIDAINNKPNQVLMSTLNYEIMLELAICQSGKYLSFYGFECPTNHIPVIKLHGSCNYLPSIGGAQISGINFVIPPPQDGVTCGGIGGDKIKPVDIRELHAVLHSEDSRVPAMAFYHKSKAVRDCSGAIQKAQQLWCKELDTADAMFIIGTRLVEHDTHIWDAVSKYKGDVYWINPNADEALTWSQIHRVKLTHLASSFEEFVSIYRSDF